MRGGRRRWRLLDRLIGVRAVDRPDRPEDADVPYFREGRDPPGLSMADDVDPAQCEDPVAAVQVATLIRSTIRPMLGLQSVSCRLVDVTRDGAVILSLGGNYQSCGSPGQTVEARIEKALIAELPAVRRVQVVGSGAEQMIGLDDLLR